MDAPDDKQRHTRYRAIDAAFRAGDLRALRAAVADPAAIPNGPMPLAIGTCLVYAIFHSPPALIRELLELGADPNAETGDGFPPLIAALATTRNSPGAPARPDTDEIIRLLLSHGANPDQRGVNDYTALHMAVAEENHLAVQRLLDAGANPALRTRIDDLESPLELARAADLDDIAATLEREGKPVGRRLRSGITIDWDVAGTGDEVRRQRSYRARLRLWLADGTPFRWPGRAQWAETTRVLEAGETMETVIRINRGALMSGLFYAVDGMRIGGTRRIRLAPMHVNAGTGPPGPIPAGTAIAAEITILEPA